MNLVWIHLHVLQVLWTARFISLLREVLVKTTISTYKKIRIKISNKERLCKQLLFYPAISSINSTIWEYIIIICDVIIPVFLFVLHLKTINNNVVVVQIIRNKNNAIDNYYYL